MTGKDDHPAPSGDCAVYVLEPVCLNTATGFEDADVLEVRVFGGDATEIVPHRANEARDLAFGKFRQGTPDIAPRAIGYTETWTHQATDRATDSGRPIEW
jgi:hypothetical protein